MAEEQELRLQLEFGGDGDNNGGSGGHGDFAAGVGAGNPKGGTGGLLIIYTKSMINRGNINSNGTNGYSGPSENCAGGGGSAGGSINIFYTDGPGGTAEYNGGVAGSGTITVGKILDGTFIKEKNYDEYNSIIDYVEKVYKNGVQIMNVNGEQYSANVIINEGNMVLDGTNNINGATLTNKVYEFGDKKTDVATVNEDAKNMVVLKVNGDITIGEGVTLTACKSDNGYGGPKGLLIYCTGTITNNGTIDMTARGARAEGQNVYLWQNKDKRYEYIPAEGAIGGNKVYCSWNGTNPGLKGEDGSNRGTRRRRLWYFTTLD